MEAYWPIVVSAVIVALCGFISELRKEYGRDSWTLLALFFTVIAALATPELKEFKIGIIILWSGISFVLLYGFGIWLGEKLISWRQAKEGLQALTEDGLSND